LHHDGRRFFLMSFLNQLQQLVDNIETEEGDSFQKTRHLAFLANMKSKLDTLAFLFIIGPFVLNEPTSYNHYTDVLCEIIRSIEIHQSNNQKSVLCRNGDDDFFMDVSCTLKKICVDISMNEDIMKIS
jgi:hypothetical protein